MMAARDAYASAYDDYLRALTLRPVRRRPRSTGFVRTAILTRRGADALAWLEDPDFRGRARHAMPGRRRSKLLASMGRERDALAAAQRASRSRRCE